MLRLKISEEAPQGEVDKHDCRNLRAEAPTHHEEDRGSSQRTRARDLNEQPGEEPPASRRRVRMTQGRRREREEDGEDESPERRRMRIELGVKI